MSPGMLQRCRGHLTASELQTHITEVLDLTESIYSSLCAGDYDISMDNRTIIGYQLEAHVDELRGFLSLLVSLPPKPTPTRMPQEYLQDLVDALRDLYPPGITIDVNINGEVLCFPDYPHLGVDYLGMDGNEPEFKVWKIVHGGFHVLYDGKMTGAIREVASYIYLADLDRTLALLSQE